MLEHDLFSFLLTLVDSCYFDCGLSDCWELYNEAKEKFWDTKYMMPFHVIPTSVHSTRPSCANWHTWEVKHRNVITFTVLSIAVQRISSTFGDRIRKANTPFVSDYSWTLALSESLLCDCTLDNAWLHLMESHSLPAQVWGPRDSPQGHLLLWSIGCCLDMDAWYCKQLSTKTITWGYCCPDWMAIGSLRQGFQSLVTIRNH